MDEFEQRLEAYRLSQLATSEDALENARSGLANAKSALRLVMLAPSVLLVLGLVTLGAAFLAGLPWAILNVVAGVWILYVAQDLWRDREKWRDAVVDWETDIEEWQDRIVFYTVVA